MAVLPASLRHRPVLRNAGPTAVTNTGLLLIALLCAISVLACGSEARPQASPETSEPLFTGTPLYHEECKPCGATFTVHEVVVRPNSSRFQLGLTIRNTGERGRLDLSSVSSAVFGLDEARAGAFSARFEQERRRGTATQFLRTLDPRAFALSHFLDGRGAASTAPILEVGQTWQGWLVFDGPLPSDTKAMVLSIQGIEGDAPGEAVRRSSGWASYTAGQPFIPLDRP